MCSRRWHRRDHSACARTTPTPPRALFHAPNRNALFSLYAASPLGRAGIHPPGRGINYYRTLFAEPVATTTTAGDVRSISIIPFNDAIRNVWLSDATSMTKEPAASSDIRYV